MEIIAQSTLEKQDTPTVWYGCYDGGWQNLIQPEAYSHPAKFSRNLVNRIYTYALERSWLKFGDTVLDPFGGVGLGALDAGANGLNWVGVELEQRFTDLGQGCDCTGISKADWVRFYGRLEKANYKDGRHFCPECLAEAKQVTESLQLSFFEPEPSAAYVRNSGLIPETKPHRYKGNLDLFRKYAKPGTFAVLLNGDSRQLRRVIGQAVADGLLSSPPYSELKVKTGKVDESAWSDGRSRPIGASQRESLGYGQTNGQLANLKEGDLDGLLSSPPYIQALGHDSGHPRLDETEDKRRVTEGSSRRNGYGASNGQLSNLKEGNLDGLLSSPPYANQEVPDWSKKQLSGNKDYDRGRPSSARVYGNSEGQLSALPPGSLADSLVTSPPFAGNTGGRGEASRNGIDAALFDRHSGGMKRGTGENPGNLDHLPMKGFEESIGGLVTSPPFEAVEVCQDKKFWINDGRKTPPQGQGGYGQTAGQLGIEQGQTFWQAARAIVAESYLALKPGSYSFWVVKAFVRDGAIVDFTGQWRQLCEACGFEFVEHIQASLVQSESEQGGLNGDVVKHKKKRSSFFRRLHEKRFPHLAIDFEDVLVMRKPETL